MQANAKIWIAGSRGLVGSALSRRLKFWGYWNIVDAPTKMDLRDSDTVKRFFDVYKPEYVFLAAAKVGGIGANNNYPVDFIQDNLQIQTNVISQAYESGANKLLFLGSSCIYPKLCPQPIKEEYLLTGALEPTNSPYAVAKIAGIELVKAYKRQYGFNGISLMPTNLYGPNDNFRESGHVLPTLIRRFHDAKLNDMKTVTCWGTGVPRREFIHCDDLADAAIFLMNKYDSSDIINVGCGEDVSIKELSELIADKVGYRGDIVWDSTKPDGTPCKLLDTSKIAQLGWKPSIPLERGIRDTVEWYVANRDNCRV